MSNAELTDLAPCAELDASTAKVIVFISYVHEDKGITDALNNALQNAFGQQVEVFVDRVSMQQGGDIVDTITANLSKADVLVVVSTGVGKPSPDWAGYELGWFNATHRKSPDNSSKWQKRKMWGNIVTFCSGGNVPGPEARRLYINLDVDACEFERSEEDFARNLVVAEYDPVLMWFGQLFQAITGEDLDQRQDKRDTFVKIIKTFKRKIFSEFKGRPKSLHQPQKKLVIRYDSQAEEQPPQLLSENATVTFSGGAGSIFGNNKLVDDRPIKWADFCSYVRDQPFAQFWTGALIRVLLPGGGGDGINLDQDQLVPSYDREKLYRLVLTSSTTYYNESVAANIYLIELYKRDGYGDKKTTRLIHALQLVTRFRFLFLEDESEFYYLNIEIPGKKSLKQIAIDIATELALLDNDTVEAGLTSPADWTDILSATQMRKMSESWQPLTARLAEVCAAAMDTTLPQAANPSGGAASTGLASMSTTQLRHALAETLHKIKEEMYPINSEVIAAIAKKLFVISEQTGKQDGCD